jgi:hypothetical protein
MLGESFEINSVFKTCIGGWYVLTHANSSTRVGVRIIKIETDIISPPDENVTDQQNRPKYIHLPLNDLDTLYVEVRDLLTYYEEIASIRFLSKKQSFPFKVIMCTTKIMNGSAFLQSLQ